MSGDTAPRDVVPDDTAPDDTAPDDIAAEGSTAGRRGETLVPEQMWEVRTWRRLEIVGGRALRWGWHVLWFVFFPCLAVALLAWIDLRPAYQARFADDGIIGTFTVEEIRCEEVWGAKLGPRIVCDEFGTFRGDDGAFALSGASYATTGGELRVGERVRGEYTGATASSSGDEEWPIVYPVDGGWDWLAETIAAASAALLLVVAWVLRPALVLWRWTRRGRMRTAGWRIVRWLRLG